MKYLYVAPRFHPNLVPIINGLIARGNEVRFIVSRTGSDERHCDIKVIVADRTFFSRLIESVFRVKGANYAETQMIFWFTGKSSLLLKELLDYRPDVVILRNRNLLSLQMYRKCKMLGIKKVILYNQSPIYEVESHKRSDIIKKVWRMFFPSIRISVCRYKEYPDMRKTYHKDSSAYFLPFVPRFGSTSKEYAEDGVIRILDSGKFRQYKNHLLLVDAAKILRDDGFLNFRITIQGQAINDEEKTYFDKVQNRIVEYGLSDIITLKKEVTYEEMTDLMLRHDIYVLPSIREMANITLVDAISLGLVSISTNSNGTADYLKNAVTGQVFKTNDSYDLADKIKIYLRKPELLKIHGYRGMREMRENYSFDSYYNRLEDVLCKMD